MPKIDAATVAEHRAARMAALLEAAVILLHDRPDKVPSPADVGKRAGLSRSSVYHYFDSSQDLLAAVIEETFPRWQRRFEDAYNKSDTPAQRVRSYVHENLQLVADGEHALARTLADVAPDHDLSARSAKFHAELTAPVAEALVQLGEPDVELVSELINSLVLTGARRVEAGVTVAAAEEAIERVLGPYLDRA